MTHVPCWGTTNIRHLRTKCGLSGQLVIAISAPLPNFISDDKLVILRSGNREMAKNSQSITNKMQRFTIYLFLSFCKTPCMFQAVFPYKIRSSKLHIQRQVFVRPILTATCCWPGWLAAGSSIGVTNTWRCMCSFELLMMDGKTAWNMYSVLQKERNKYIVKRCNLLVVFCEYISDARAYEC